MDELFGIHSFATVHQMISSVSCTLGLTRLLDIMRATFPMGSMTGAQTQRHEAHRSAGRNRARLVQWRAGVRLSQWRLGPQRGHSNLDAPRGNGNVWTPRLEAPSPCLPTPRRSTTSACSKPKPSEIVWSHERPTASEARAPSLPMFRREQSLWWGPVAGAIPPCCFTCSTNWGTRSWSPT